MLSAILGIAGVGVATLLWVADAYEAALTRQESATVSVDLARETQVAFKNQVLEWRTVLVAGGDPDTAARAMRQYSAREAQATDAASWLIEHLDGQPVQAEARRFASAQADFSADVRRDLARRAALPARAPPVRDRLDGVDRNPSAILDELVELLRLQEARGVADTRALVRRMVLAALVGCSALLGIILVLLRLLLRRWITRPLLQSMDVADRLARGERGVDIRSDAPGEAGQLMSALRGLRDALVTAEAERVEYEMSLVVARDEAIAASEARERFLGVVSHELRTPLNAVAGALTLIEPALQAPQDKEMLVVAMQGARRLEDLVDDVITFTAARARDLSMNVSNVAVRELIDEAAAPLFRMACTRGLRTHLAVHERVPTQVRTDPALLRLALHHLLDNAVRFTVEGSVAVDVDMHGGDLVIRVVDTGPGMTEAALQRAGLALHQLDDSASRRHGGLGLGLALARTVAEQLGGTVAVHSDPAGTRVVLRLDDCACAASGDQSAA